jgi:hypothetical protein
MRDMTENKEFDIELDRDMWKLRYVALCEMTSSILNMEDEEVNEIINSQIQSCVNGQFNGKVEKLNG